MPTSAPKTVDRRMLQSYLSDHLTGAEAGRSRSRDMAERYAGTEIGPELQDLATGIEGEHDALARIIDQLGLRQPLLGRLVAKAGEVAGRLKPNGRLFMTVPTTPLLEVELMRSAVNGKRGLWETLAEHADELGLDQESLSGRVDDAVQQSELLDGLHARLRVEAFDPDGSFAGTD